MDSTYAARIINVLRSSKRKEVAIPASDFKQIFFGLTPKTVNVNQETEQPISFVIDREEGIKYLENKYAVRTLCGDSEGKSEC